MASQDSGVGIRDGGTAWPAGEAVGLREENISRGRWPTRARRVLTLGDGSIDPSFLPDCRSVLPEKTSQDRIQTGAIQAP